MEKLNRLGQWLNILVVMAIVITGMSSPALAGTEITASEGSLNLAQASLVGQCRAVKLQIPIFRSASATSEALRLLATDEQVTLAGSSNADGLIGISAPVNGFVHAINLKACSNGTNTSGNKGLCRKVARPAQGLVIRREPSVAAAQVGGVAYLGRVTLTTTPATAKQVDGRNWVEISSPARGWVSNGLLTQPLSNLEYCQ